MGLTAPNFFAGTSHVLIRSSKTPGSENDKLAVEKNKFVIQYDGAQAVSLTLDEWHDK